MSTIIREDLDGVVTAYQDGKAITLLPGQEVPDGVTVGAHVTAEGTAAAGAPAADRKPLAEDPSEYKVAEVNDYLAEHPDEAAAVLALEEAGEARKGILQGPHAPKTS